MPSKEKSYANLDHQSLGDLNNPKESCSQNSNKSSGSNGTRSESQSSSDSERESNPSISQKSTQRLEDSFVSNRSTSSVGSTNRSQSQISSKSGSDSDSKSDNSQRTKHSQESRLTNSQNSSTGSMKSQRQSQNSEKKDYSIDSNSQRTTDHSEQSKISNSQLSSKSMSSVTSKTSQTQSQILNKSCSDSDSNSDGSDIIKKRHSVHKKLIPKKAGNFSDSEDEKSSTISAVKTIQPLDDSDSDSIINISSKKKTMSKNSIRKLLDDDSSSASDSKNTTLGVNELASDSSGKSSLGSIGSKNKNLKVRRRITQQVASDSSDEESSVATLPKNLSTNLSSDDLPGTIPNCKKVMGEGQADTSSEDEPNCAPPSPSPKRQNTKQMSDKNETTVPSWKKSMGAGLLDDSSSEDERDLDVPSPNPSSESETRPPPKNQNKKFRKTKEKSDRMPKKSSKELEQEAKDVHSHSQRHRRVEHAELPYHVPKQRSLAEFMARRQTLPAATGMSLKMPSWQLKEHWKQMAEQEKEATLFFQSESDHSEDETETSLNQVSAILSKELGNKLVEQEKITVEEKSHKSSIDAAGDCAKILGEKNVTTSVDDSEPDTFLASASNKEISQDVLMECDTSNLPSSAEKIIVDSEIDCDEMLTTEPLPLVSTDCKNLNDNHGPLTEKNEIINNDDHSSDSDVALRLSDSEDEKGMEIPSSKTENEAMQCTENTATEEQKTSSNTAKEEKKQNVFEFRDLSSDSETEAASSSKSCALEKNENLSDKKLAMLRRRGLIDVANIKPRLSGSKNEIIDLNEDVASKQSGLMNLMQRFIKHSSKKKPKGEKTEVKLSIVSAEQGADGLENVQKELVTILLGEEEVVRDPVPGAKLRRLKQTLQKQMALKRNADWKRKMEEKRINSEALGDEELSDCGMLDEETEMTDSEEDGDGADNEEADDEEEEEEEDEDIEVPLKEKKRPKSEFLDEEADESDEGDADVSDDEEEEDEADDAVKGSDKEEKGKHIDDPMDKLNPEDGNVKSSQSKSKFKRLRTLDMFDSDDDLETSIVEKWATMETNEATTPTSPMITPGQNAKSPVDSQFAISPMIFNRRSAPTQESPIGSQLIKVASSKADDDLGIASTQDYLNEIMKGTTVRPKEPNHTSTVTKFLFKVDETNSQIEDDELLSLCSGKFHTQVDKSAEDELAALYSGRFTSRTQMQRDDGDEFQGASQLDTDRNDFSQDAQDFGLETQSKGEKTSNEVSSPKMPLSVRKETIQPWMDLDVVSSDDENEEQYKHESKLKKKTQKKLNFSDEEDEEDELGLGHEDDLEGDVGEDLVEDVADDVADESAGEVDYDSEENEVHMDGEEVRQVAKDFFEAEAELSESEWGSEDEDEKDLDKLDYAAADEEQFDQDQMKEQLDKIHMRQILDADKREVRMLQEMLFEDGELHAEGGGRERKFRWKNAGDDDMNLGVRKDSGDEGAGDEDEAEDEEKWRIMRHDRETFLREQKEKAEAAGKEDQGILEDEDSQFLKLGKAALKRIRSVHSQEQIAIERKITLRKSVSDILMSPDAKRKCNHVVQRGSFLARGETALARIAAITRGTTEKVVLNAKNSRNFVFSAISPKEEVVEEPLKVPGKRKTPFMMPTMVKKVKVMEEKSKGRRLFDHLD